MLATVTKAVAKNPVSPMAAAIAVKIGIRSPSKSVLRPPDSRDVRATSLRADHRLAHICAPAFITPAMLGDDDARIGPPSRPQNCDHVPTTAASAKKLSVALRSFWLTSERVSVLARVNSCVCDVQDSETSPV